MRLIPVALAALALSGCASGPNIYHSPFGQRVVGNSASVIVTNVWNQADAFPIADQHCQQFGEVARFVSFSGTAAAFDCVAP